MSGKRDEAQKVADELEALNRDRYVPPYNIATVYAGLGEKEKALSWLEKGYADHNPKIALLKVEPEFDNLRSDPRYAHLLQVLRLN